MSLPSLNRLSRPALLALLCAALAACATGPRSVRTDVTSFNEWSSLPADRTYAFARTLQYQNSLEMQSYENIVRDELTLQGFRLTGDPSQAELVVTLRPSLSSTSVLVGDPWAAYGPFWGPYGGFRGRGFYGAGYGFYGGSFWGYDGFDRSRVDVFHKTLELDIDARAAGGKRFYEGKVEISGPDDALPRAMPVLIRALFTDFPGNNGQTRRVDVPVERVP